jgi:3-oxoacyl-[acyl-carrier-protein] synthase III
MYINAVGHYLPNAIVSNEYYAKLTGLSDGWIRKRSGIGTRTRARKDENTNTMGIEAVKAALKTAPYPISDVDLIVGATYTPYDTVGTLAHAVQGYFDISCAKAITITSACSSFLNAVVIVEGYFAMNKARRAIVIVSEHNSAYSDDLDEQSGYLWGDGAAAVFISKERLSERDLEIIDVNTTGLANVGKGIEGVWLRPLHGGLKMPYGKDIFTHACRYMVAEVQAILEKNRYSLNDISHVIPHQANSRIIDSVAASLGLQNGRCIVNVKELGNTGCASTAVALSQNWHRFLQDELIVITVFGGGYSSGAMLLRR